MDINIPIPWLNEEFVPVVDPQDVKAAWSFRLDTEGRKALHGGINELNVLYGLNMTTIHVVLFRMALLYQAAELGLIDHGKPSDAMFKAVARVPVKVTPNLEYKGLPCDLDELLQLIEKEKGPKS